MPILAIWSPRAFHIRNGAISFHVCHILDQCLHHVPVEVSSTHFLDGGLWSVIAVCLPRALIDSQLWCSLNWDRPFHWGPMGLHESCGKSIGIVLVSVAQPSYTAYEFQGFWVQSLCPSFPTARATMLALRLDCWRAELTTHQKALPNWNLWSSGCLASVIIQELVLSFWH